MSRAAVIGRVGIATVAIFLLAAHTFKFAAVRVDGTSIALLGVVATMAILDLVRRVRFGEIEAEIEPREVAQVADQASAEPPRETDRGDSNELSRELVELSDRDPQLGLAKLRIELEQRLKRLYALDGKTEQTSRIGLSRLVDTLVRRKRLAPELAEPTRELLSIANRAIHGEAVRASDARRLAEVGAGVLQELQWSLEDQVAEPVESEVVATEDVESWFSAKYRVTTVTPLADKPRKSVRILSQEGLDLLLDGYEEYAEFLVGVERVPETH